MFGLESDTLRNIKHIFSKFNNISKVILYGSRAKGNHKTGSDIDITLLGDGLNLKIIYAIQDEIEELYLPYSFDISIFSQIDNENLIEHINRVGKVFYKKKERLPEGWQTKKLDDLCDVITKGTTPTSVGYKFSENGINFIKIESITVNGEFLSNKFAYISKECHESLKRSQLKKGDVLFSIAGALGRTVIVSKKVLPANINQALAIIRLNPSDEFCREFILLALNSEFILEQIKKVKGGVAQQNLSLTQIKNFQISLPPLPEQKRIVKVLDEVFEKVAKAKENAEKNLQNARELFESYLQRVFVNTGDGWEERNLGECFKLKSGDMLQSKFMNNEGDFPVYGGNGIAGIHDKYNLEGSNVIVGRVGALCGNVRHINEKIWLTDNAFYITDSNYKFDHGFLAYLLNYKNLRTSARQAAQPVISNSSVKDILLQFPISVEEQQSIITKFDTLSDQTKKLEAIYQQKLADLDELKKSILQKAFAGEL